VRTFMDLSFDFKGKVVLVTGAAGGMGIEVAKGFVRSGASVLAADIDASIDEKSSQYGGFGFCADVSDSDQVERMVNTCISQFGPPDVLVNVAAISTPCLVQDMPLDHWQRTLNVNLTSVFLCTTAVLPHMLKSRKGSIISFSSGNAAMGGKTTAHYSAAKGGIEAFSRSLAREVGPAGIRVNVVAPGMVDTPMLDLMAPGQKAALTARLPLPRLGIPLDLVGPVLFLASDAAAYITGHTLHVNGGMFMQ
jgi:NAD(P)-dependent dehydrogenase (short-subunit alcohol dehydrogenase family)